MDDAERNYLYSKAIEERDKRDLVEWLENHDRINGVRTRTRAIDFRVGEPDDYPDYHKDDHINAIGKSSITTWQMGVRNTEEELFVTEIKIHLPPAHEDLKDAIDDVLNTPDGTAVHYGTGALGGMPAPDGLVTPHIMHTEDVTFDATRKCIELAVEAYVDVYDEGEKARQMKPEEYRNQS